MCLMNTNQMEFDRNLNLTATPIFVEKIIFPSINLSKMALWGSVVEYILI